MREEARESNDVNVNDDDDDSEVDGDVWLLPSAYSHGIKFHGIMIDTGAGGPSTCGHNQLRAWQELGEKIELDTSSAGSKKVRFGIGRCESIGHVDIKLPCGLVTFHVMPADTPFLLGIKDMDRMGVYYDNLDDHLIRKKDSHFQLVTRKFGHPFLTPHAPEEAMAFHHMTEKELRGLHRRFGHPSTRKLRNVLDAAGHTYKQNLIENIMKYCHQCQLHGRAPHRFKFTLKDPLLYNHTVQIDLVKIGDHWVLHVVDEATGFHAAEPLKDMSAIEVWRAFDKCWNNVMVGPPVYVAHDPGKHFQGDFQTMAKTKGITTLEKGIEAHHSVGQVEKGNHILKRIYDCVADEQKQEGIIMPFANILQIAVKALNDTAGPNGLVPTLLVFGAYPRMTMHDKPTANIRERAKAIKTAFEELRIAKAKRKVADALATPNGPNTLSVLNLQPGDDVIVWREKAEKSDAGWVGPWQLLSREGENVTIDIGGPKMFPTTHVRPYYREQTSAEFIGAPSMGETTNAAKPAVVPRRVAKKRGRPKGSKNKSKHSDDYDTMLTDDADNDTMTYQFVVNLQDGHVVDFGCQQIQDPSLGGLHQSQAEASIFSDTGVNSSSNAHSTPSETGDVSPIGPSVLRNANNPSAGTKSASTNTCYAASSNDLEEDILESEQLGHKRTATAVYARAWITLDEVCREGGDVKEVFLTSKEKNDLDTAIRLRAEGRITTPGEPFVESIWQEIQSLMAEGVFKIVPWEDEHHKGTRIFNSRMVNEIKGKMDIPYEKSRLVIQAWNDTGKQSILTQSPTIQRSSQRLLLALAPSMMKQFGMMIALRDITQAYIQSLTVLQRLILFRLPSQIAHLYPGKIGHCLKPLYGIPESGAHWFLTYWRWLLEELGLSVSTYDPCLLSTRTIEGKAFGMVGLQADDTILLGTPEFIAKEDSELKRAKFRAKPATRLSTTESIKFNGCHVTLREDGSLLVSQQNQTGDLQLVDLKSESRDAEYRSQRARGAYVSTLCQPEAQYDLSVAAQHQEPTDEDVVALNKRLQWQLDNPQRGLNMVPVDLETAKVFVFVDGSFANNKDLSSQIGYMVVLGNEVKDDENGQFKVFGNLIHWSSTKCKRVTGSVLASELFAMSAGADMAIAINSTITNILEPLGVSQLPLVMCTDSMSLYDLLVKLGTTKEKRLMIDVMGLREAYERRVLTEVRHIDGKGNPADAFTKDSPNQALSKFIDTNEMVIGMKGWVTRGVRDTGRMEKGKEKED